MISLCSNIEQLMLVVRTVVNGMDSIVALKELKGENAKKKIGLSISVKEGLANFYYKIKRNKILLTENIDITNLSTEKAKGFVGAYVGMYATSLKY